MKSYFKLNNLNIKKKKQLSGDKSLSHRFIIFSLLKKCIFEIYNLLESFDVLSTINLCNNLGIVISGPINSYILVFSNKKKKIEIKFII